MPSKLRRYEILLPLKLNDDRQVPRELLADATVELVERFGALSHETQTIEGHWKSEGIVYRDQLVKLVIDIKDNELNRKWMRDFKQRWRDNLQQIDLWVVSYEIEVE